jgi:hypothetical protein
VMTVLCDSCVASCRGQNLQEVGNLRMVRVKFMSQQVSRKVNWDTDLCAASPVVR